MQYNLAQIADITSAHLEGDQDEAIQHIVIDSREYYGQQNSIFVAIKGPNNDGHDYLKYILAAGIKVIMISETHRLDYKGDAHVLRVKDTVIALQELAAYHRSCFQGTVIGITGSSGKTIVKEWLYFMLKSHYNICRSPKSYNSQIGVPLSLLQMRPEHNLALIEAGISKPAEMIRHQYMIQPDIGILTNIGSAHRHNFDNPEHHACEKKLLFKDLNHYINTAEQNNIIMERGLQDNESSQLIFKESTNIYKVTVPFADDASLQNIHTVVLTCRYLKVKWDSIIELLPQLPTIALRLEILNGKNQCKIINDSYNSDVNGLQIALSYLKKMTHGPKTVILSSLQIDSTDPRLIYERVFDLLNKYKIENLITVGQEIGRYMDLFKGKKSSIYPSTDALINNIDISEFRNEWILIKGARNFAFEKLTTIFEDKPHSTYLEVNLKHIAHNLNAFRNLLSPGVKVMAMVKAFTYGSGNHEIAKHLQHHNIDYFGVAYTTEGISLRQADIDRPIMVMNSDPGNFSALIEHQLEPVIYSITQLDKFIRELIIHNMKQYPIHIELDTGMHRLGFEENQLSDLCKLLKVQPEVKVKSIFSHLAAADDKTYKDQTEKQISLFKAWSALIEDKLDQKIIKHICNSHGVANFTNTQLDMVRIGIGLHGSFVKDMELKPSSALYTQITQLKQIKKGEGVGYGYTDAVTKDTMIGIIPIGYADGFSRVLSNGKGFVYHERSKKLLPTIGRVCMDMTMINALDVDIKEGDRIQIFGPELPVMQLSEWMNTIPYEILSSISSRVTRKYVE